MGLSLPHLIVLALIVLLLFGRGKITDLMGDFGKGIKSFKEGIADEAGTAPAPPPVQLTMQTAPPAMAAIPAAQVSVHPAPAPASQPMLNGEPLPVDQQTRV